MKTSKMGDKIVFSSDDQFYDDCPICRAMKKAKREGKDIDPVELAKAFNEAKEVGGKIGSIPEKTQHD